MRCWRLIASATLRGGCVAEPRAKLDSIIAGPSGFQGGLRSPLGIHLRGPVKCLILRRFQTIWGGFRLGWTPKKNALTLAKLRAQPPTIVYTPRRTRKINELGIEAHPVSQLADSANETDRSTLSSHDHLSAAHSPCDLGAKLHSRRQKESLSGVSPKIVSLARKGLTGLTTRHLHWIDFSGKYFRKERVP